MINGNINIYYYKFDTNYKRLDEETFYSIMHYKKENPSFKVYGEITAKDYFLLFMKEFGWSILILNIVGAIVALFIKEEVLFCIFGPTFLWFVLGGEVSVYNFFENLVLRNRFYKKLNNEFLKFKNYEDYSNFLRFEKL